MIYVDDNHKNLTTSHKYFKLKYTYTVNLYKVIDYLHSFEKTNKILKLNI